MYAYYYFFEPSLGKAEPAKIFVYPFCFTLPLNKRVAFVILKLKTIKDINNEKNGSDRN